MSLEPKISSSNVRVVVRIRPPATADEATAEMITTELTADGNSIIRVRDPLYPGRAEHLFNFDRVFEQTQRQDEIFLDTTQPLVDQVIKGYSACLFAYGATDSGKTYTTFGDSNTGEGRGQIVRAAEYLLAQIGSMDEEFGVVVSFFEIYLDQVILWKLPKHKLSGERSTSNIKGFYADHSKKSAAERG